MALEHTIAQSGSVINVALFGDFTFTENAAFRRIIDEVAALSPSSVAVDLSNLRTVDSAGLSMLVLLREKLKRFNAPLSLLRPPPDIERILDVVDFGSIFTIMR